MNRRKARRLKQQTQELEKVFDSISAMLNQHGIKVEFPWQLPSVVRQLLELVNSDGEATTSRERTLAALTSIDTAPEATAFDPFGALAGFGAQAPAAAPAQRAAPPQAPPQQAPQQSADMQRMQAQFAAKQDQLFRRIATEGIKHRNGAPHPSDGKRAVVHEDDLIFKPIPGQPGLEGSDDDPFADDPAPSAAPARRPSSSSFDSVDFDSLYDDEPAPAASRPPQQPQRTAGGIGAQISVPKESSGGDRPNPHTGLTLEQQRQIIGRSTGRAPKPPSANESGVSKDDVQS